MVRMKVKSGWNECFVVLCGGCWCRMLGWMQGVVIFLCWDGGGRYGQCCWCGGSG